MCFGGLRCGFIQVLRVEIRALEVRETTKMSLLLNSSTDDDASSNLEAELLQKINVALPEMDWEYYHSLIAKRQAETITSDELDTLVSITDRLEIANAQRIQHLIELAKLRGKSLEAAMEDLGIRPASYFRA
jgi:hypothetical protein